ncbi:uncharacterized protein LOC120695980 [Panicum virgatum]|uniref:uncharacterized protein LOC120695980 n=1 Tax=Panicum virgatum TaxID=38727 RepID=UPI0019D60E86|nr:uncharacterized protein LOC120695980 [Panicum virgatum]
MMGVGSASAGTSAHGELGAQPTTLPEDVESFDSEGFVKSLGVYGTENLGIITASLCLKALLASRVTVQGSKKDEVKFLAMSSDNLRLTEESLRLKKENKALGNLRSSELSVD